MATKTAGIEIGIKKLRHGHPMYTNLQLARRAFKVLIDVSAKKRLSHL